MAPRQFLTLTEPGARPGCDDGIDNDGDGLVDMADPGCPFPCASPENPQCDDGIDNDGDGLVDFADPKCSRAGRTGRRRRCGLGAELALVMGASVVAAAPSGGVGLELKAVRPRVSGALAASARTGSRAPSRRASLRGAPGACSTSVASTYTVPAAGD